MTWAQDEVQLLPLEQIDERLQRYRLAQPKLEKTMAQSLARYGQVSPIVICVHSEEHVLIDGFKRLGAARKLKGISSLKARRMEVDEQGAKAAIYNLNRIGQRPLELEESWIVHALVREDGLSQVEVAQLLGRHKSWVNRRLAMLERLCDEAREELRLGLLTPAIARQLTRLPRGNQAAALKTAREASLTSRELGGVVDLLLASSTQQQTSFVLNEPRRALRQSEDHFVHQWDPRLSVAGNRRQTPGVTTGLPGQDAMKLDHEYVREGSCNIWMFVEPLAGWRDVTVTLTKKAVDWARQIKVLADNPRFAVAKKITVVCDNLNTHLVGSLYQAFGPEEAFRLMNRIDLVHTPKHGSWLNMAEPELSVLTRQCFTDRVGEQAIVEQRCAAWTIDRNKRQKGIDWQFTNQRARVKLKRLYPKIEL